MMRRVLVCQMLVLVLTGMASADVAMVEHRTFQKNLQDKATKRPRHPGRATGSQGLIDASGLQYFINTNIASSNTDSASGAASEASYTHAVAASTANGGTTSSTLTDAFDGYNALCLSFNNTVAPCTTDSGNFGIYNQNGPATTECKGAVSGVNRQVVFPVQTIGPQSAQQTAGIQVQRKVFVPDNDSFARWLNYFTNTGATPQTVTMVTANNLGSDSNTKIVTTSNGNNVAEVTDSWVTTFQNFSGTATTTSDPRLGHVLQNPGAPVQLSGISFVDGDDNPFWGYTFTLAPGETKIIANFVTGQPSRAKAAAKAAELAGLPPNALQCLTSVEKAEIANFQPPAPIVQVPTLGGIGLFAMAAGLALAALMVLLKRRSTTV